MPDYVSEPQLRAAFIAWQAEREAKPGARVPLPESITAAASTIADRLLEMPCFSGYTFDLKSGGLLQLVKYGHCYKPQYKAFQFVTMLLKQGFCREIELERKQRGQYTVAITDASENYMAAPAPDDGPPAPAYGVFATLTASQLTTVLRVVQGRQHRGNTRHVLAVCTAVDVTSRAELVALLQRHGASITLPIERQPAPSMKKLGRQLRQLAAG